MADKYASKAQVSRDINGITVRPVKGRVKKKKPHELWFTLGIQEHDRNTKLNQAQKFLEKGKQVRIRVQLKGRERSRPEYGFQLLDELVGLLSEYGTPANPINKKSTPPMVMLNPVGRK